ncbi:hypothetical protein D9M72_640250 [compost metagenome]
MAAHAEVAAIVEKDHPGTGPIALRRTEQGADQHLIATRFEHAGPAPVIVFAAQQRQTLGHRAGAKIGETGDHQPGRFAACM